MFTQKLRITSVQRSAELTPSEPVTQHWAPRPESWRRRLGGPGACALSCDPRPVAEGRAVGFIGACAGAEWPLHLPWALLTCRLGQLSPQGLPGSRSL